MYYLIPLIILLSILNGLVLQRLARGQIDYAKLFENDLELKVPIAYKYLAYVLIALGFIVVLIGVFKFGFELKSLAITCSIFLLTLLTGTYTLLYQRNHRVLFNQNSIIAYGALNKLKELQWDEIQSIKLNTLTSQYLIRAKSRNISINQHLIGLRALLLMAEKKGVRI